MYLFGESAYSLYLFAVSGFIWKIEIVVSQTQRQTTTRAILFTKGEVQAVTLLFTAWPN